MPRYHHKPLSLSKVNGIVNALDRGRRHPVDGPMLERFSYDHGSTLFKKTGQPLDLLIDSGGDVVKRDIASLLSRLGSVDDIRELAMGYRIAVKAGLIKSDTVQQL